MPEAQAPEQMRDVVRNLFTIEVSTILKRGMSAEKMPPAPIALLDIAGEYYSYLSRMETHWGCLDGFLGCGGRPFADVDALRGIPAIADEVADPARRALICAWRCLWRHQLGSADTRRNSRATFETLAGIARLMRNAMSARVDDDPSLREAAAQDFVIVQRIHQNASVLATLVEEVCSEHRARRGKDARKTGASPGARAAGAQDADPCRSPCPRGDQEPQTLWNATRAWFHELDHYRLAVRAALTTDEITLIRKVWETGTEVVVMQSVVQLDGDVITRIHPDYAGEQAALLQGLHNSATRTAIRTWFDMARLVKELVEGTLTALTALLHREP